MSRPIIEVRNLSKVYQLGTIGATRLKDEVARLWERVRGRHEQEMKGEFWALRDVSFEVRPGEVVGIIGRNGAGKSTLFKILSRITQQTSGEIVLRGRVASLLEIGTGFHPDLTGRENIYLNGAILGMTKAEIRRKLDEIIAFAEVEKFIETPVKRYSSGMYVRLAFAVAAYLEPEILIVDEVLAVGDAEFQKKCLGKMQDVSQKYGRTVLFVSHNMPAVTRLCQRALLLDGGRIVMDGDTHSVSTHYLNSHPDTSAERFWQNPESAPGDETARLKAVRILQDGVVTGIADIRRPLTFEMEYWSLKQDLRLMVAANFFNNEGVLLFVSADLQETDWRGPRPMGTYLSRCEVPGNYFAEGIVRVLAEVCTREPDWKSHVREVDIVSFNVVDLGEPGSVRDGWQRSLAGVVRPMLPWKTTMVGPSGGS